MKRNRNLPSWMTKVKNSNDEIAGGVIASEIKINKHSGTNIDSGTEITSDKSKQQSSKKNNTFITEFSSGIEYLSYDKKIHYFTEYHDISIVADELLTWVKNLSEEKIPMGFDMEWPFCYQRGPYKTALIQLCPSLNVCYLFQVWTLKTLPRSLTLLLQHERVLLHGVRIINDIRKLRRDFPEIGDDVEKMLNNCVDLGALTNKVLGLKQTWSMARLVRELLKTEINKDKAVRASKWNHPLSQKQKKYAAIDVYASQLMYLKLKEIENKLLQEEIETLEKEIIDSCTKDEEEDHNTTKDLETAYNQIQQILANV